MRLSPIQKTTLSKLIDKYEGSATYKGTNKVRQSFSINVEKAFPRYQDDSDYEFYVSFNDEIRELSDLDWVKKSEKHKRISRIILNSDAIPEIYKALGRCPRKDLQSGMLCFFEEMERQIKNRPENVPKDQYDELSRAYLGYIRDQRERITENKSVSYYNGDMSEYRDIWRVLLSLFNVEGEVFVRDLSIRLFRDSKRLEKLTDKAEGILFEYGDYPEKHHILEEYGIIRIPAHVCVKGNIELYFERDRISLQNMTGDIGLSERVLAGISDIIIYGRRIVTIENLTSFYKYDCGKEDVAIYLAGYHNRQKRDFLKLIYGKYPALEYYHFGDIDAGGFYIYEHLRRKTGIPFKTMKMDKEVLLKYREYTKKLTANDKKRIGNLIEYYRNMPVSDSDISGNLDTLNVMLKEDMKLEQEAVY